MPGTSLLAISVWLRSPRRSRSLSEWVATETGWPPSKDGGGTGTDLWPGLCSLRRIRRYCKVLFSYTLLQYNRLCGM